MSWVWTPHHLMPPLNLTVVNCANKSIVTITCTSSRITSLWLLTAWCRGWCHAPPLWTWCYLIMLINAEHLYFFRCYLGRSMVPSQCHRLRPRDAWQQASWTPPEISLEDYSHSVPEAEHNYFTLLCTIYCLMLHLEPCSCWSGVHVSHFYFFFASVGATCVSHPCVIVISAHAWRTMCILRERTKSSLQRFECWRWGQRWSNRYALGTCFYTQQCGSDCSYAQAVKLWVYKLKVLFKDFQISETERFLDFRNISKHL